MADFDWGGLASTALQLGASAYTARQNKKAIEDATRQQQEAAAAGSRRLGDLLTTDPTSLPGYQFAKTQSDEAVMRAMRATGQSQSGAAMKALQDRSADLANQYYGQNFNRAIGVAQGQNALGSNYAGYGADGTLSNAQNRNSWITGAADVLSSPSTQKTLKQLLAGFYSKPAETSYYEQQAMQGF